MSERKPGLDLLRCAALLFVVSFHSFLNNGYYHQDQQGLAMWLAGSARWLSVSCIGIFLMLTGYLRSPRRQLRPCLRGLGGVLLGYLLACVITVPIRHFLFGDTQSISGWIHRLLGFSAVYYGWYVEMYTGLILLSPFVNLALERMTDRQLLGFCAVLLILTALPGAIRLPLFPDYWRSAYPLTYYVLGAAVRRLQPKLSPRVGIGAALAMALVLSAATVLSTDETLSSALTWEFPDLWIVLMVLGLFLALYRLPMGSGLSQVLAFCAKGCYGGYLLSHLLDAWCYRLVPQWCTPGQYPKLFLCVTVPIFLVSLLGGRLLQAVTEGLLPRRREAVR